MSCSVDIENYLSKIFDMKDLGEGNVSLGMRIFGSEKGIHISLSHSIEKMLRKIIICMVDLYQHLMTQA